MKIDTDFSECTRICKSIRQLQPSTLISLRKVGINSPCRKQKLSNINVNLFILVVSPFQDDFCLFSNGDC